MLEISSTPISACLDTSDHGLLLPFKGTMTVATDRTRKKKLIGKSLSHSQMELNTPGFWSVHTDKYLKIGVSIIEFNLSLKLNRHCKHLFLFHIKNKKNNNRTFVYVDFLPLWCEELTPEVCPSISVTPNVDCPVNFDNSSNTHLRYLGKI